ncbi:MAG TPA: DegT/DnrJ/EryC1/StrS family aminotransferase [Candidatus Saccharimonadales bacterium]|jgi:dTDP-4-amino-4,6-dideoxygalactose transaminase|nr:DegT/DnrJ/EryC1/StrS family aminotransferase [Candidatus Saccharimonadales bacterium]
MPEHIPFIKPEFPSVKEIAQDLEVIYENNYYSNNGPIYYKFVDAMEAYLGQGLHVVALNNATTAIMLAMKACFKTHKKYVALPSFTFPAGPLAAQWCGYEPLFFDIDENSLQPSLSSFKELYETYGHDIAGVLLVNEFGIGNAQIQDWDALSKELGIPMVIDSAPGIGSTYPDGELLGGHGLCEVFSMHATKPFGVGEGGLITTKDKNLAERLESLKNFGFDAQKLTDKEGLNGKITELDCAIGLRIIQNYESVLDRRRHVQAIYERLLIDSAVRFLPFAQKASIQFATILVDAEIRNEILAKLAAEKIDARTYYAPPLHHHMLFKVSARGSLTNTEKISEQVISLPVHNDMTSDTVGRICNVIKEALHDQ